MDGVIVAALFAGGFLAGGISAIAGGSSFLTFPMLLATGLTPLVANITNWVSLTPGNFMALAAYREELAQMRPRLVGHVVIGIVGGALGSLLLIWAGEARFERAVPWLMLIATVFFALGGWLKRRLAALRRSAEPPAPWASRVAEFVLMVYGGYFGAGLGIVLLAVLAIAGQDSIHRANAQKNLMTAAMSVPGAVIYVSSGLVVWAYCLPIFLGSMAGSYLMVRVIRKVPEMAVRNAILVWAVVLTMYSFWRWG